MKINLVENEGLGIVVVAVAVVVDDVGEEVLDGVVAALMSLFKALFMYYSNDHNSNKYERFSYRFIFLCCLLIGSDFSVFIHW